MLSEIDIQASQIPKVAFQVGHGLSTTNQGQQMEHMGKIDNDASISDLMRQLPEVPSIKLEKWIVLCHKLKEEINAKNEHIR